MAHGLPIPEIVGLKNASDVQVNPATEDGNLATLAGGVTGAKYQIRSLTSASDSVEAKQATGTNLHTVVDSGNITVPLITGFALETGGNLAQIKSNTDPFLVSSAGGYIRQDSTATIAKESGGNLAGIKTQTDKLTFTGANLNVQGTVSATTTDKWYDATSTGKGFVTTTNNTLVAGTAEVPFMLIRNPVASGKTMRLYLIISQMNETGGGTPRDVIRMYRDPTVTGAGTGLGIVNLLKSGGASVGTASKAPTVSANGTLMSTHMASQISPHLYLYLGQNIQASEDLLITAKSNATNQELIITVYWVEE